MKKLKANKGITLIALVVTIIVILLIAGISISMLTGENGILTQAGNAVEETDKADVRERIQLELIAIASAGDGTYTTDNVKEAVETVLGSEAEISGDGKVTTAKGNEVDISDIIANATDGSSVGNQTHYVADVQGTVLSTEENTEVEDANGNKVVVPAGFKITTDASTVEEGIVIEDATDEATKGSQFVWIPVGTINKTDGSTEEITLGRYVFSSDGSIDTDLSPTELGGELKTSSTASYSYTETSTGNGNTVAKNIEAFISSAEKNGGYYIGRYEARTATARSSSGDTLTTLTEVGTEYVYNYVTQLQAAELCENMYDDNSNFTSDLINSYAWDTATLFLQTCGTNSTYSRQTCLNTSLATQGTNNTETVDKQCNVYDMASNVWEWTTETYSHSSYPCVNRGGGYYSTSYYTSSRFNFSTTDSYDIIAFRPLLYL